MSDEPMCLFNLFSGWGVCERLFQGFSGLGGSAVATVPIPLVRFAKGNLTTKKRASFRCPPPRP